MAIACVMAPLMVGGCGGETTAVPQRATSDGGLNALSAALGTDGSSDGVAGGPDAHAADSATEAAPLACTMPSDCPYNLQTATRCCVDDLCAAPPPASCADAGELAILVSSYDQSCSVDSDCTTAADVSACYGPKYCDYEPIAMTALSQYRSDVAMLPTAPCVLPAINCPPPPMVGWPCGLCCRTGACQQGDACCGAGDD
jgi:hypothetical protein